MNPFVGFVESIYRFFQLLREEKEAERKAEANRRLDQAMNVSKETGDTSELEKAIEEDWKAPF